MNERKENIMGTKPVNGLLVGMAVPIMLSMLVQAMYNIVDSIFVSMLSENALTSVSLIFPIQNLMIAVGVGTSVGMNALLSRKLGEKNYEAANRVAENGLFLSLLSGLAFALLGIFGSDLFMRSFTDNAAIAADGATYMRICTIFSVGLFMQITTERILQVTGKTVYQMCSQMTGAIINIILDPILIFGLLGAPKMGVAGAALATVIGQWIGMLVGFTINAYKNHEVHIQWKGFRPDMNAIKGIYQVGLPTIIMQSIGSVMVFGMNKILIAFTETAVSVFGIYFKLQSFVFMPVFGITNAMVPIVGYNYGARSKERIVQCIKISLIMVSSVMAIGTVIFQAVPVWLLSMFNASESMLAIGVPALRMISICFCFAGVAIVFSSVFQALGNGMYSLWMSVIRQLVLLLPSAYVLAKIGGLHTVWFSFVFAEVISIFLAVFFFKKIYREKIQKL